MESTDITAHVQADPYKLSKEFYQRLGQEGVDAYRDTFKTRFGTFTRPSLPRLFSQPPSLPAPSSMSLSLGLSNTMHTHIHTTTHTTHHMPQLEQVLGKSGTHPRGALRERLGNGFEILCNAYNKAECV
jgi:hypothetical protein